MVPVIVRTDDRIPTALRLQLGQTPSDRDAVIGCGASEAAAAELARMATAGIECAAAECAGEGIEPSRPHDWGLPAEGVRG